MPAPLEMQSTKDESRRRAVPAPWALSACSACAGDYEDPEPFAGRDMDEHEDRRVYEFHAFDPSRDEWDDDEGGEPDDGAPQGGL